MRSAVVGRKLALGAALFGLLLGCGGGESGEPPPGDPQAEFQLAEPIRGQDVATVTSAVFGHADIDRDNDGVVETQGIQIIAGRSPTLCDDIAKGAVIDQDDKGEPFNGTYILVNAQTLGHVGAPADGTVIKNDGAAGFVSSLFLVGDGVTDLAIASSAFTEPNDDAVTIRALSAGATLDATISTTLKFDFTGSTDEDISVALSGTLSGATFCQAIVDRF